MIHCPVWRPPGAAPHVRRPATRSAASENSGPSIHGIGVPSGCTASPPPRRWRGPPATSTGVASLHLPMQKREKMTPSRSSAVNSPVIAAERGLRLAQFLGEELERRRRRARWRAAASRCARAVAQRLEVPLAREEHAFHVLAARRRAASTCCRRASTPAPVLRRQPDVARGRARRSPDGAASRSDAGRIVRAGRSCCGRRCAAAPPAAARRSPRPPRRAPSPASRASTTTSARSARSHRRPTCARCRASRSDRRSARKPAVSITVSGMPSISIWLATVSRVVPAIGVTIATSSPASRLRRLDLPTFGWPISTTASPSRSSAPCRACASTRVEAARGSRRACRARRRRARKSMSSSGKSSVASVNIRSSISASTSAWISSRELAGEAARGGARGRRRGRVDQVGDTLGLREIELAVEERALREFAGLREPRAQLRRSARAAGAARPGRRARAARARDSPV